MLHLIDNKIVTESRIRSALIIRDFDGYMKDGHATMTCYQWVADEYGVSTSLVRKIIEHRSKYTL